MLTKMKNLVLSFLCAIVFVSCGTNNDTPEPPTNAKVDYYVDYEIDGKKEKYIIDTGHLNTVPNLQYANGTYALTYYKTYDATNFAGAGGISYPLSPFGKSVYTQTIYPNISLYLVLRNFSAIKSGDELLIDSCSINQPFGNGVGLTYLPVAPPFNDSLATFYDLGINPLYTSFGVLPFSLSIDENAAIKGKNGKIKIISKTFHSVTTYPNMPPSSFYILKGEITGDFMKYKVVKNKRGDNVKVNLGYKSGKVSFQLPFNAL
jgi:hypothetical protein